MKRRNFWILLLIVSILLSACKTRNYDELNLDDEGFIRKLTIELTTFRVGTDKSLHEKIRRFDEERSDVEVEIRERFKWYESGFTPWLLDKKGVGDSPDLIELTPNQMKMAFHHGKIDALNLNQPQLRDLVISSPEGDVIGVKSKINPLIVYYHQDTFLELGLEAPSKEWDWVMLDNTITALKEARKNVYIMLSPSILEWLTINRYGGRIVDTNGTMFSGYLDSEQAIQAAEWLKWVGTKEEDYKLREFADGIAYFPIPLDLVEGNMAFAIDFAHVFRPSSKLSNFEAFIQHNDRIGIAPLPGGSDVINMAHTSGLVIPSYSENKDIAMDLLRYLTDDVEAYYEDILWYTLQADSEVELHDHARISMLLDEMKRSVPTSLFMYEDQNHGKNDLQFRWERRAMMDGQSIEATLAQLALEVDLTFDSFHEDLEYYSQCIKQRDKLCHSY